MSNGSEHDVPSDRSVPLIAVQSLWTSIVGATVLLFPSILASVGLIGPGTFRGAAWAAAWNHRAEAQLSLAFAAMALMEILVFQAYRRNFDFSLNCPLDKNAWRRVGNRWGAFAALLGAAWGLYFVLNIYDLKSFFLKMSGMQRGAWPEFSDFFRFFLWLTPILLVLAPPYYWLIERFASPGSGENDPLLLFWRSCCCLLPLEDEPRSFAQRWDGFLALAREPGMRNLLLSSLIKFYFAPYMIAWYFHNYQEFERWSFVAIQGFRTTLIHGGSWSSLLKPMYLASASSLFMIDGGIAFLGYVSALKILDTHVRSAEVTLLGWAVTLACYPPFNQTTTKYLAFGAETTWLARFQHAPGVAAIWCLAILGFWSLHISANIAFALRFSNLTNRGIISHGPYAWVRHPAYVSKNLCWWLMALPFVRGPGDCIRLLGWNVLYIMRAITEERHLMNDARYREYAQKVPWRFVPGIW